MLDFYRADYPQPHVARSREILKKYPNIKELYGNTPSTAIWAIMIVATQFLIAYGVRDFPWWGILIAAWTTGAVLEHALFVIIHECAHNMVFKKPWSNKIMGIVANAPGIVPSSIAFRNYHLLHHRNQGELGWDADMAGEKEAALVGNNPIAKVIWLFLFPIIQGIVRPARVKKIFLLEFWAILNLIVSVGLGGLFYYLFGLGSFMYLLMSLFASIGLHPLGGRWFQEHYTYNPPQETYSYYGPANKICFNVGHHNEHHDFLNVPWSRLPAIRKMAPEFYDTLHYHTSWTKVLWRFLSDPNLSLYSRVLRPNHSGEEPKGIVSDDVDDLFDDFKQTMKE